MHTLNINEKRFLQLLESINAVSPRLAYTPAESDTLHKLDRWMESHGIMASYDSWGNYFFWLRERGWGSSQRPAVLFGSHIDTVDQPGRFDGVLGSAAALETLLRIQETGLRTSFPPVAIIHRAEESARFGVGCLGSKLRLGLYDPEKAARLTDRCGHYIGEALQGNGPLRHLDNWRSGFTEDPLRIQAYLELHIEQGPSLEARDKQIGVVVSIATPTRIRCVFQGRPDHSGTTPMNMRQDALQAAAGFIQVAPDLRVGVSDTRVTVGQLTVEPNSVNTVPSRVTLTVDLRPTSIPSRERAIERIKQNARFQADLKGCTVTTEVIQQDDPQSMCPTLQGAILVAAQQRGYSACYIVSGASHDAASYAAAGVPSGMIFVPSVGGRSHCPEEETSPEDCIAGAQVLCDVVTKLVTEGVDA